MLLYFLLRKTLRVLALILRSVIHVELIFVYGEGTDSLSTLLSSLPHFTPILSTWFLCLMPTQNPFYLPFSLALPLLKSLVNIPTLVRTLDNFALRQALPPHREEQKKTHGEFVGTRASVLAFFLSGLRSCSDFLGLWSVFFNTTSFLMEPGDTIVSRSQPIAEPTTEPQDGSGNQHALPTPSV